MKTLRLDLPVQCFEKCENVTNVSAVFLARLKFYMLL